MFEVGDVNWLAVVVAVVAHQVLGFLWYGPLFGRMWMSARGTTREEMQARGVSPAPFVVAGIGSLLSAIALALLLSLADEVDAIDGLMVGLLAGIGFAAPTSATAAAYEEGNPTVTWLYIAYQVAGFAIMGAILGAWR